MQLNTSDSKLATYCAISGLCVQDQSILAEYLSRIEAHLPAVTDAFYDALLADAQTAPYLEGRLEGLKATHLSWIRQIFCGVYDDVFVKIQERIGEAHVRAHVPPHFVAASISHLRAALSGLIQSVEPDLERSTRAVKAMMQVLGLCHYLIDSKYSETLMGNLGISPALLTRLQTLK
ncbi:MAG: protoglobin domain-containing protein [Pseudomonadota bacterium]